MRVHLTAAPFAAIVFSAGLILAADDIPDAPGLDDLIPSRGEFEVTMIRPGADMSVYRKVVPAAVRLEYREIEVKADQETTGSLISKRPKRIGTPKRKEVNQARQVIDDAFAQELAHSGLFEVVEKPGPDTLIVRTTIVDIVTPAVLYPGAGGNPGEPPFLRGTIVFDLVDAETGLIQARLSERRRVDRAGAGAGVDGLDARWGPVSSWARDAAADLCNQLERVRHPHSNGGTDTEA
jgi:hypothetical protein